VDGNIYRSVAHLVDVHMGFIIAPLGFLDEEEAVFLVTDTPSSHFLKNTVIL